MKADDALLRQIEARCDFGEVLPVRRVIAGGDAPKRVRGWMRNWRLIERFQCFD